MTVTDDRQPSGSYLAQLIGWGPSRSLRAPVDPQASDTSLREQSEERTTAILCDRYKNVVSADEDLRDFRVSELTGRDRRS